MGLIERLDAALRAFKGPGNIYGLWGGGVPFLTNADEVPSNKLIRAYEGWVYACVDQRAKAVGAAFFRAKVKLGADRWQELDSHKILDLLERPNPDNTKYQFLYRTVTHLDLTGDAYWYIAKDRIGRPAEMWLLQSDRVTIIPSEDGVIASYELDNGINKIPFSRDEIVHLSYPCPYDPFYGIGPLSAARYSFDIDQYQHKYQRAFYRNSAIPPIALVTDKSLGDVARAKLRTEWQNRYGGSENQGRTPVLDNGLKVSPIGVNPKDLDWLSTSRQTRDDILAIFGVPASKLGLVEDVNRSSAVANDYTFAKNTVEPILTMIDEQMTLSLARQFDASLYIAHDTTIPRDAEERVGLMNARLTNGITTRNEERELEGYGPVEGGDEILVPVNYQPLARALNPPDPVPFVAPEGESVTNS